MNHTGFPCFMAHLMIVVGRPTDCYGASDAPRLRPPTTGSFTSLQVARTIQLHLSLCVLPERTLVDSTATASQRLPTVTAAAASRNSVSCCLFWHYLMFQNPMMIPQVHIQMSLTTHVVMVTAMQQLGWCHSWRAR